MKNNNLWVVVGVALVIGLVAGIVGAGITGNVIKQNNNPLGYYQVYTKAEVDAKIKCAIKSPQEFNLEEGSSVRSLDGKIFSIEFLNVDSVKIKVGGTLGEATNLIYIGGSYTLSDGTLIHLRDISYQEIAGTLGSVQITYMLKC